MHTHLPLVANTWDGRHEGLLPTLCRDRGIFTGTQEHQSQYSRFSTVLEGPWGVASIDDRGGGRSRVAIPEMTHGTVHSMCICTALLLTSLGGGTGDVLAMLCDGSIVR